VGVVSGVEAIVISLPTAIERREALAESLKNFSAPWRFFDAVNGAQTLARPYQQREAEIAFGRPLTSGELGCFSSHLLALEQFLTLGKSEWVLILEDDILFDTRFPLEDFAAFNSRYGIEFVRLFGRFLKPYVTLGFYYDRQIIRFRTSPAGSQAYMMSRRGAARFVESVTRLDTVYDIQLDRFWVSKLPIYAIFPYPAIESFSPTSIPLPPRMAPLPLPDLARYYSTKVYDKLSKLLCDAKQRPRDLELLRLIPSSFRQVDAPER
jgi:glycosyl transferase family 25